MRSEYAYFMLTCLSYQLKAESFLAGKEIARFYGIRMLIKAFKKAVALLASSQLNPSTSLPASKIHFNIILPSTSGEFLDQLNISFL
jgi:hypothetical protein